MQRYIAIIFTLLYITAMIKPAMPIVTFYINQDYIAEFLCVNKDKPKMACNGKCHLKKMIEEEQEDTPAPIINLREYPLALISTEILSQLTLIRVQKQPIIGYQNGYSFLSDTLILRPPIFA